MVSRLILLLINHPGFLPEVDLFESVCARAQGLNPNLAGKMV